MKKSICILMIAVAAMLGGCSKGSDRQALPTVNLKVIERVMEQVPAPVPEENENSKAPEVTGQALEPEAPTESVAEAGREQEIEPAMVQETTTSQLQSTKARQTTEEQQAAPEPQTPTPEPPALTPEPETTMPQPPTPKSIYDYEFDVEAIRAELIAIGQGKGLTHITTDDGNACTPDNSSWALPITASQSFQGDLLKRALQDYVSSMPDLIQMTGGNIQYFTIYVEPAGNDSYTFYFLY